MTVAIVNRQRTRKINMRLLKQITNALLAELQVTEAELGVILVGEAEMSRVNETFLNHHGSTDVITFDHSESKTILHGEIFICIDDAITQAHEFKTTWQSEAVRYVIHGMLHLLGHDDHTTAARRRMKCEENRLLRRLAKEFPLARLAR